MQQGAAGVVVDGAGGHANGQTQMFSAQLSSQAILKATRPSIGAVKTCLGSLSHLESAALRRMCAQLWLHQNPGAASAVRSFAVARFRRSQLYAPRS